ncbi:MAG: hypothetical protein ACLVAT_04655 [Lachnospiraceae bacterium]
MSKYLSELGVEGSAAMEAAEGAQITVKSNCNIRKNHRRMQNPSANWWVDRL